MSPIPPKSSDIQVEMNLGSIEPKRREAHIDSQPVALDGESNRNLLLLLRMSNILLHPIGNSVKTPGVDENSRSAKVQALQKRVKLATTTVRG